MAKNSIGLNKYITEGLSNYSKVKKDAANEKESSKKAAIKQVDQLKKKLKNTKYAEQISQGIAALANTVNSQKQDHEYIVGGYKIQDKANRGVQSDRPQQLAERRAAEEAQLTQAQQQASQPSNDPAQEMKQLQQLQNMQATRTGMQLDSNREGRMADQAEAEQSMREQRLSFDKRKFAQQQSLREKELQQEITKARLKAESKKGKKPLGSSDRARFDNALMVYKAIGDMDKALTGGDNTFSLIGDNNYTISATRAAEAFGRMQSGGAINKEEENRFRNMLPTKYDSTEIQRKKLQDQRQEMLSRLKTLGFTPEELNLDNSELSYGVEEVDGAVLKNLEDEEQALMQELKTLRGNK